MTNVIHPAFFTTESQRHRESRNSQLRAPQCLCSLPKISLLKFLFHRQDTNHMVTVSGVHPVLPSVKNLLASFAVISFYSAPSADVLRALCGLRFFAVLSSERYGIAFPAPPVSECTCRYLT